VPRLSIIIPHQNDDTTMESTILSVLENRPDDSEIIVVHDGSYSDPYQLGDELLLIEEGNSTPAAQVNAGLLISRAPLVCVLANGAVVSQENWADEAIVQLTRSRTIASFAVTTQLLSTSARIRGIRSEATSDLNCLQTGQVDNRNPGRACAPTLSCGFYRRRILLAIGGWNDQIAWENADIELAFLMSRLGLLCEADAGERVVATTSKHRCSSSTSIQEMADLAIIYGLTQSGLPQAVSHLLKGLLSGKISRAVAWSTGLLRAGGTTQFSDRIKSAELGLHRLRQQEQTDTGAGYHRRAA
jgi:glycosyltransferase involved in cell wall biosynthesis